MISVIIPVHNAESFLERCINSILTNTYKDLEVILIENGSTDSSRDLCYRLEKENSNVKVIVSEVKGVSNARNLGLVEATGDYVAFVDADDYVSPYYFETLLSCLREHGADFAVCNCEMGESENYPFGAPKGECICFDNNEYYRNLYVRDLCNFIVPWAKLIKKQIAASVKFDTELTIYEDRCYISACVSKAEKICFVNEKMYYYYRSEKAISRSADETIRMDMVYSLQKDLDFMGREYRDKTLWIDFIYLRLMLSTDLRIKCAKKNGRNDLLSVLKPMNKEALAKVKKSKTLGKMKFRALFEHYFPNTLQFLYQIAQKLKLR